VAEGIYDFHDLPAKAVRLLVTYAGKVHEVVADAADETARIEMPATGSVVVRFEGELEEPVIHRVRLVPSGEGTEVTADVGFVPERDEWEVRVPAVMPGRYRVLLEYATDRDEDGKLGWEVCRKSGAVDVGAGREAEARLPR
ncbi:MAG: hypothetical protein ABFS86_15085, partial [Planctomycetota bacterium]